MKNYLNSDWLFHSQERKLIIGQEVSITKKKIITKC